MVAQLLQTTPVTIQTLPSQPSASDLKGKLYEAIKDDPEEEDIRKALVKSMKKAQQKEESCKQPKTTQHRHDDPDKYDEP